MIWFCTVMWELLPTLRHSLVNTQYRTCVAKSVLALFDHKSRTVRRLNTVYTSTGPRQEPKRTRGGAGSDMNAGHAIRALV